MRSPSPAFARMCTRRRHSPVSYTHLANTTYGENTGVLALSKIYDPRVIRIAAVLAMLFSFSPKFAAIISSMPGGTIGGVSLVLYGMISAVGVRNVVENKVDFTNKMCIRDRPRRR